MTAIPLPEPRQCSPEQHRQIIDDGLLWLRYTGQRGPCDCGWSQCRLERGTCLCCGELLVRWTR